jgi:hypothetical protein
MNRHPLSQKFHDTLAEMGELHDRKQADYGRPATGGDVGDPFANIRSITAFGLPAWAGSAVRMGDKMRRIEAAVRGQHLQNESVEDSFLDIAVYAIIGLILLRESSVEKTSKNKGFCDGKTIRELADEMTDVINTSRQKFFQQ